MKILAIRGRNLASLAGDFELDLASPPLGTVGIFSLGGPTGAGKSTVLDAMCLALYGKTPRTDRAGTLEVPDSSGQGVTAQNPTLLLRRGCGEGFAEADFIGMDGVAYRARWTANRARKNPTGKLQAPEHGLFLRATGQPLGGKRNETLALIEGKLGLDFSQFTRAVLLAQNDFAAFLTAKSAERAKLLETLTGTERFGVLSVRIFERAKAERDRLERMALEAGAREPLGAEARAELERFLKDAGAEEQACTERAARLEVAWTYREHREALAENVHKAKAAREQAESRWKEAALRKAEIERTLAVQAEARPLVEAESRCRAAFTQAETEGVAAEGLAHAAERARAEMQAAADQAKQEAEKAEEEARRLRPVLDEARRLDTQLEEARPLEVRAARSREEAAKEHARKKSLAEDAVRELARLESLQKDDRAWLEARGWLAPLAGTWASKREALRRALRAHGELGVARATAGKTEAAVSARRAEVAVASTRVDAVAREATDLDAEACTLAAAASTDDLDRLEARERQVAAAVDAYGRFAEALRDRALRKRSLEDKRREVANDRARAETLRAQSHARGPELEQARRDLDCAKVEHRTLERMANATVETLRATLREGEACPVCGSTEHPILARAEKDLSARLRAELEQKRGQVATLEARCRELEGTAARDEKELAGLEARVGQGARAIDEAVAELARHEGALRREADAVGAGVAGAGVGLDRAELEALDGDERESRLAAQGGSLALQLATAREARDAVKVRDKRAAEARSRATDAQVSVTKERESCAAAERVLREKERERDAAVAEVARLEGELRREREELSVLEDRADWVTRWNEDPGAAARWLTREVEGWIERERAALGRGQEIGQVRARLPDLERGRDDSEVALRARAEEHAREASRVASLSSARQRLLEGKDASAVEKGLDERREAANRTKETAALRLQSALEAATAARTTVLEKERAVGAARKSHAESQERLGAWLEAAVAASPPRLRARDELSLLLGRGDAWRLQEEEIVSRAQTELGQTRGLAEQARAVHEEHVHKEVAVVEDLLGVVPVEDHPRARALELTWLAEGRSSSAAAREAARERRAEVLAEVRRDDESRKAFASVQEAIARQRSAAEHWGTLDHLLGSKSGDKLRGLAQEVTLDLVLVHANLHLAKLARRYRLERLPGGLDLVVVDLELLDEKRGIASLSGGETFLVSLSLALGLASLSAEKVRVETLFIDEGFGSLDAHTLQIALEALHALQAEGRQIGIISHVGDLAERLGAEVRIEPMGHGRSRLRVVQGRVAGVLKVMRAEGVTETTGRARDPGSSA